MSFLWKKIAQQQQEGTPRPSHHANSLGTAFKNPWASAAPPTWTELALAGVPLQWAKSQLHRHPKARDIKVVKPDWGRTEGDKGKGNLKATWLGHASSYVELPWVGAVDGQRTLKLLFDPMFSYNAGPTSYTGPGRLKPAPCETQDLPGCDCVFISHNHYDHLDYPTIVALKTNFPDAIYFVPLGNKTWLMSSGIEGDNIHELDWWDDRDIFSEQFGVTHNESHESRLRVTCVPAQHNSGRSATDQATTLWCGWVVEHIVDSAAAKGEDPSTQRVTRRGAIYHAGDTGYRRHAKSDAVCPVFEEIGAKFGPFDISFIPIWRGGSLGFVSWAGLRIDHERFPSAFHGSPVDAVSIHQDVKSRNSIGVHFGTFIGAEAESLEAVIELLEACEEAGIRELDSDPNLGSRMGVIDIGATFSTEIENVFIF